MTSWVGEMIVSYTENRRALAELKRGLNPENPKDAEDEAMINSMIRDMSESIDWLRTGKDPKVMKGIHVDSVYHVRSYENVDLIPDIERELREENDINKKHLFMTSEEKIIMSEILASFSERERICYLLHVGHKKSFAEIANELGISRSTVQTHITRAKNKVKQKSPEVV
ncbi:sigma-70 family RNA polymerase sigma factor [Sporosarcina sp. FSL W7-1283]|uniref:sigma-70 family RNA polymerase sigma factor n=1 Tax=Sporosarcina sp. FSL W7-1283 TaxID=2921560 RepID=UPI0030FA8DEF